MFPLCLRYIGDRIQAEDVLQDGFVTLFTKLESYKGDGSFEGWARRIFVTTALMSLRKKDALKMSEEIDQARGMRADTPSQGENIGYKELMTLVMSLPPGFRTVFNMYAIEGYTHKEIADALHTRVTGKVVGVVMLPVNVGGLPPQPESFVKCRHT